MKAKLAVQLYGESLVGRRRTCGDVRRPKPMEHYYPLPELKIVEVIKPKDFSIEEQVVAIVTVKEYDDAFTHEIKEGADLWFKA